MSSRLRKVEQIEVFDMEGEMVAAKEEDPFSYTYQKEYYFGEKRIGKISYKSNSRKILLEPTQLHSLKKRVNKMLNRAFCYVDDAEHVEVVVRGGSTIKYTGAHKNEFMEKVLTMKMK